MPFEAQYYVYWSETDAAGIVHFAEFFRLVERAEEDLYRRAGVLHVHGSLPRIEAHIRYRAPLRRGDVARVVLTLDEARRRAVRYRFEIYNDSTGRLAAEGYIAAACVEFSGGEPRAVECPEELYRAWRGTDI